MKMAKELQIFHIIFWPATRLPLQKNTFVWGWMTMTPVANHSGRTWKGVVSKQTSPRTTSYGSTAFQYLRISRGFFVVFGTTSFFHQTRGDRLPYATSKTSKSSSHLKYHQYPASVKIGLKLRAVSRASSWGLTGANGRIPKIHAKGDTPPSKHISSPNGFSTQAFGAQPDGGIFRDILLFPGRWTTLQPFFYKQGENHSIDRGYNTSCPFFSGHLKRGHRFPSTSSRGPPCRKAFPNPCINLNKTTSWKDEGFFLRCQPGITPRIFEQKETSKNQRYENNFPSFILTGVPTMTITIWWLEDDPFLLKRVQRC